MLARIGEPARPALVEMVRDADPAVREVAVRTLGEIGAADSIQVLAGALYDRDDRVRMEAGRALGAAGAGAIPVLLEALRFDDEGVRLAAVAGLAHLPPGDSSALGEALERESPGVHRALGHALRELSMRGGIDAELAALQERLLM